MEERAEKRRSGTQPVSAGSWLFPGPEQAPGGPRWPSGCQWKPELWGWCSLTLGRPECGNAGVGKVLGLPSTPATPP